MENNNLYEILGITELASDNEIKKAYRKLAKIYHPDKNINKNTTEKFLQIKMAYDILIDPRSRAKYDNMNILTKNNFYDFFMNYVQKQSQDAYNCIKFWLMTIYDNNEYLDDINSFRFDKIFEHILEKIPTLVDKSQDPLIINNVLNIEQEVYCDLLDRYMDNYLHIKINRKSREEIFKYVPLRNDINIYNKDGEIDEVTKLCGSLIIYVKIKNLHGFKYRHSDLFKKIETRQDDNETINYYHIDGTCIKINREDFANNEYIVLKERGLPKQDNNNDTYERGDLILECAFSNFV